MLTSHLNDSAEQRSAETFALEAVGKKLGVELLPRRLQLPDGSCVEIDGGTEGPPPVLAEVYAHQGRLKGGQFHKLLADAFKPASCSCSPTPTRLVAYEAAGGRRRSAQWRSRSWLSHSRPKSPRASATPRSARR
jgi:hypothetical protein